MTYLEFHALFLLPPIAALTLLALRTAGIGRRHFGLIGLLCAIALVYTTPWDNYLVYRGIWSYGPERVVGTIGYVPIEEYLFFILQPALAGLLLMHLRVRLPDVHARVERRRVRLYGSAAGLALAVAGIFCVVQDRTLYLGLILIWAGPVIAGQWYLAGERFLSRTAAIGIGIPTIYLWIADHVAIREGIWSISERYTIGWTPLGLPVEEAVFFLVTNTLVVQGLLMFKKPRSIASGPAETRS